MYTRYYDGYGQRNMPRNTAEAPTLPSEENIKEASQNSENTEIHTAEAPQEQAAAEVASIVPFKLPGNMKTDDLILLAVLFLILSDSGDDIILPLILGYLFISNM